MAIFLFKLSYENFTSKLKYFQNEKLHLFYFQKKTLRSESVNSIGRIKYEDLYKHVASSDFI